ncbi:sentrin-specific protease 2 isoform X2 [Lampris incognitus]|uniref:sentrin-specific protease 2 isoform X2 n=1 Tax=Lampris incognitus TaxID=2546036 RepID=UPI0024B4AD69|nr:sentrin-specific protease 2 isoform X2 [Lampris incognitus]
MYGWMVDGISSLFKPVTGQKPTEWPGKGAREESAEFRLRDNHARPAKRNYQSVYVADNAGQNEQVEVKRRRRDVVIGSVKKAVEGVACLLRLRNPSTREKYSEEETQIQPVTLMGIDELHSSWMSCCEWRMDKTAGGLNERDRDGKNPFQSTLPPFMRKYRPALGVGISAGATIPDAARPCIGQNRCYKSSLTVEEAIKNNNKEHYRRLLEMVTEKYNKSQPLPFSQTRPQEVSITQGDHKATVLGKTCESVIRKMGPITATQSLFLRRDAPTTKQAKDRRGDLCFTYPLNGAFGDKRNCVYVTKPQAEADLSTEVATHLNLVDRENPALTRLDTHTTHATHTWHCEEDFPRLTKDMAAEVSRALAQSDPNLVLSAAFKLRITQRDLITLQEGSWLNDEVINFYLSLVMEHCTGQAGGLKVYSFSTFFFPKLDGGVGGQAGGYAAVKRWTKAVDLFLYDLILVPLHLGIHWAMAVVDFKSRTVRSYDSMGQRHDDVCSLLLRYLREEHNTKKGRDLDSSKWTVGSLRASEIPQQKNGSDCGVFACKYAHFISKGRPLTFKQCHMPLFRKLMMWEILNQKLL